MAVAVNIKANIEMENLVFLPGASGNIDFWRPVIKQLPRSYQSTIFTYPEFGGAEAHAAVNDFDGLQRYILERIVKGSNIRESSISDGVVEENHVQDANVLVESVPTANMQKIRAQDPHLQDAIMLENPLQPVNFNIQDLKAIGTLTGQVERLAFTQTTLIAQSMGGIFAVQAALRFPELIKALVLVATSGGIDLSGFDVLDWRQDYQLTYAIPHWFVGHHECLDDELSKIECPILLIWGDQDQISPVRVGQYLASKFRNAELHVIQNGQHDLAAVYAHDVAKLIQAFLEKNNAA